VFPVRYEYDPSCALNKRQETMDNVQNCDSYINIQLLQTYIFVFYFNSYFDHCREISACQNKHCFTHKFVINCAYFPSLQSDAYIIHLNTALPATLNTNTSLTEAMQIECLIVHVLTHSQFIYLFCILICSSICLKLY
jgi:hypothetical protein